MIPQIGLPDREIARWKATPSGVSWLHEILIAQPFTPMRLGDLDPDFGLGVIQNFHFGSIDDEYERLVKERKNGLRSSPGKRPRI
jgi:hypothetical protein